jgi:hypothetical protein
MMPSTSVRFSLSIFLILSFYANLCVHSIFLFLFIFSMCVSNSVFFKST